LKSRKYAGGRHSIKLEQLVKRSATRIFFKLHNFCAISAGPNIGPNILLSGHFGGGPPQDIVFAGAQREISKQKQTGAVPPRIQALIRLKCFF
jgi:hypothetical protein